MPQKLQVVQDEIRIDGKVVRGTPILARLLKTLLAADRKVVSGARLMAVGWGLNHETAVALTGSSSTLRVHMNKLRTLLGSERGRVVTVRGSGYRLVR